MRDCNIYNCNKNILDLELSEVAEYTKCCMCGDWFPDFWVTDIEKRKGRHLCSTCASAILQEREEMFMGKVKGEI